jgi:hypothetical protein
VAEKLTQFDYLLNALEFAAQAENPAKADYGGARQRLFAHVRELARKAAVYDAMRGNAGVGEVGRG